MGGSDLKDYLTIVFGIFSIIMLIIIFILPLIHVGYSGAESLFGTLFGTDHDTLLKSEPMQKVTALASEYNKTRNKSSGEGDLYIKGKVLLLSYFDRDPGGYYNGGYGEIIDNNITVNPVKTPIIFDVTVPDNLKYHGSLKPEDDVTVMIVVDEKVNYAATRYYHGHEDYPVKVYTLTYDVIVIQWPELKVLGWKKINATTPNEIRFSGHDKYPEVLYDFSTLTKWIESLPVKN